MRRLASLPSRYGSLPARVWIGSMTEGLVDRITDLGCRRVFLVTDPGVHAAGHAQDAVDALVAEDVAVAPFDRVVPNPDSASIVDAAAAARAFGPDGIVAVGGGSVMDTAKGVAMCLASDLPIEAWQGFDQAEGTLLPLVAVPTTAGTGSEVQSFALVSRVSDGVKMACGASGAMPRDAVLDPTRSASAPKTVQVIAAVDALVHALETYVTLVGSDDSRAHARAAFGYMVPALAAVVEDRATPHDHEALLVGACMAGQAIEASMLGAAHALANPLTAHFHLPHGVAVGITIPHVVRFNAHDEGVASSYATLAKDVGWGGSAEALAHGLETLFDRAGLPRDVRALAEEASPALIAGAMQQWTGSFNPRTLDLDAVEAMYAEVWRVR